MKSFLTIISILIIPNLVLGQSGISVETKAYQEQIKSIKIYKQGDDLSIPIINLYGNEAVELKFDDLDASYKNFYYTIIHCDAQWVPSDISQFDYIEGYFENQIYNSESSFNTLFEYNHYTLQIPNKDMRPKISGNYILLIYEDGNQENQVLSARFMVLDEKIDIEAGTNINNAYSEFNNQQEITFTLKHPHLTISNVTEELDVIILQNCDWKNSLINPTPDYIENNEIRYNNFTKLVFNGGNEYRFFNSKNIRYAAENIERVDFMDQAYHFLLTMDQDRTFADYAFREELNGNYRVDKDRSSSPLTEADYVYVYFTLEMELPLNDGQIYVYGDMTNHQINEQYEMLYNVETKAYEKRLLLKQGYYNYKYLLVNHDGTLDHSFINGNKYQTENDYQIFVYHYDMRDGYDKLVGFKQFNSREMITLQNP